jgi:hypothetical protein
MSGRERTQRRGGDHDFEQGARANPSKTPRADDRDAESAPWIPSLDSSLGTEVLLNSLIAECHSAVRNLAIPLAAGAPDPYACRMFLSETVSLARAGAAVGKTVAMLRAADRYAEAGTFEQVDRVIPAIEKNG